MAKTKTRITEQLASQVAQNDEQLGALVSAQVAERMRGMVTMPLANRGEYHPAQVKQTAKGQRTVQEEQTYDLISEADSYTRLVSYADAQASAEGASLSLCYHILSGANYQFGDSWEDDAKALTKVIREHVKQAQPEQFNVILAGDTFRQARAAAVKAVAFNQSPSVMLADDGTLYGRMVLKTMRPKAEEDLAKTIAKALELIADADISLLMGNDDVARAFGNLSRAIGWTRADAIVSGIRQAEQRVSEIQQSSHDRSKLVPISGFDGKLNRIMLEHETAEQVKRGQVMHQEITLPAAATL